MENLDWNPCFLIPTFSSLHQLLLSLHTHVNRLTSPTGVDHWKWSLWSISTGIWDLKMRSHVYPLWGSGFNATSLSLPRYHCLCRPVISFSGQMWGSLTCVMPWKLSAWCWFPKHVPEILRKCDWRWNPPLTHPHANIKWDKKATEK